MARAEKAEWHEVAHLEPLPVVVSGWSPEEAELKYLARLATLLEQHLQTWPA
jgi:hypothetical protein